MTFQRGQERRGLEDAEVVSTTPTNKDSGLVRTTPCVSAERGTAIGASAAQHDLKI